MKEYSSLFDHILNVQSRLKLCSDSPVIRDSQQELDMIVKIYPIAMEKSKREFMESIITEALVDAEDLINQDVTYVLRSETK
jgi:hypothetical protein